MPITYDEAQICENGHLINGLTIDSPASNKPFCDKCGSPTITACKNCNKPIQGHSRGTGSPQNYTIPAYCSNCGQPYSWTKNAILGAHDLAAALEMSKGDQMMLNESVDAMIKNSPASPAAAVKFKHLMIKAGKDGASMFHDVLVDVRSESLKKMIWP